MQLNDRDKQKAINIVKHKLLETNIRLENHESMALNLLKVYNWDLNEIIKYAI